MHLSPGTLRKTPFLIANMANVQRTYTNGTDVGHVATDRVKLNFTKSAHQNVYMVQPTHDPNGNTIYLPFHLDEVHSVQLPANPGAGGPTIFLTANLDGCCMFIEVKAGGNVVVYHANAATGFAPTAMQSATQPTFQTAGALNQIVTLHNAATANYPGATQMTVALRKAIYLQEVHNRLQHKTNMGRTGVQFGGGAEHASYTTFAGFFINNKWEFWYQTYSQFIYDRPANTVKARLGYGSVDPDVTHDDFEIVVARMFFRAP